MPANTRRSPIVFKITTWDRYLLTVTYQTTVKYQLSCVSGYISDTWRVDDLCAAGALRPNLMVVPSRDIQTHWALLSIWTYSAAYSGAINSLTAAGGLPGAFAHPLTSTNSMSCSAEKSDASLVYSPLCCIKRALASSCISRPRLLKRITRHIPTKIQRQVIMFFFIVISQ